MACMERNLRVTLPRQILEAPVQDDYTVFRLLGGCLFGGSHYAAVFLLADIQSFALLTCSAVKGSLECQQDVS